MEIAHVKQQKLPCTLNKNNNFGNEFNTIKPFVPSESYLVFNAIRKLRI